MHDDLQDMSLSIKMPECGPQNVAIADVKASHQILDHQNPDVSFPIFYGTTLHRSHIKRLWFEIVNELPPLALHQVDASA